MADPCALLARIAPEANGAAVRLSGGDMGEVWRCGHYVVKTHAKAPPGMFPAEARGLEALAAEGVRTPAVYWVAEEGLVMEYLQPGVADWRGLAQTLARLHASGKPDYGSSEPVFLGRFGLPAGSLENWREFWLHFRLLPLLRASRARLGGLAARLERFVLEFNWPAEGAVLIHGDLWHGNVVMSQQGAALIDPSAWRGERIVDIAMMRLFGGFPEEFWRHYLRLAPLSEELERAIPAYQLYFLLAHVYFFGGGYLASVEKIISNYQGVD